MIETTLAFILGYLVAWPSWFILIGVCLWADYAEAPGWTVFVALLFGVASFFLFGLSFKDLLWAIPVYVVVGIAWSLWRWKRRCDKKVSAFMQKSQNAQKSSSAIIGLEDMTAPANYISLISAWIITWPFGLVSHSCSDIFNLVGRMVNKYLIKVYENIGKSSMEKINIHKEDNEAHKG